MEVSVTSWYLLGLTGQIELIHVRLLFQVVHNVPIFAPGKYQAKGRRRRYRYPVEREDVLVFKLLH